MLGQFLEFCFVLRQGLMQPRILNSDLLASLPSECWDYRDVSPWCFEQDVPHKSWFLMTICEHQEVCSCQRKSHHWELTLRFQRTHTISGQLSLLPDFEWRCELSAPTACCLRPLLCFVDCYPSGTISPKSVLSSISCHSHGVLNHSNRKVTKRAIMPGFLFGSRHARQALNQKPHPQSCISNLQKR